MAKKDNRVTEYINKSESFAQPILKKLRELVHQACPEVEETIKWSFPHFDYKGPMCHMASFKKHCAFGFNKSDLMKDPKKIFVKGEGSAMSSVGKMHGMEDMPDEKILLAYLKEAMSLNEKGVKREKKPPRPVPPMPEELKQELKANWKAEEVYENFPPGCKREYLEWIIEAKTEATRIKRAKQAVEWMAEGKKKNWKYEK